MTAYSYCTHVVYSVEVLVDSSCICTPLMFMRKKALRTAAFGRNSTLSHRMSGDSSPCWLGCVTGFNTNLSPSRWRRTRMSSSIRASTLIFLLLSFRMARSPSIRRVCCVRSSLLSSSHSEPLARTSSFDCIDFSLWRERFRFSCSDCVV